MLAARFMLYEECVPSRFYQWYTNIVQGSTNDTCRMVMCSIFEFFFFFGLLLLMHYVEAIHDLYKLLTASRNLF